MKDIADQLADALRYLKAQTVDMDIAFHIDLTEGEADALKMAEKAIEEYDKACLRRVKP